MGEEGEEKRKYQVRGGTRGCGIHLDWRTASSSRRKENFKKKKKKKKGRVGKRQKRSDGAGRGLLRSDGGKRRLGKGRDRPFI